MSGGAKAECNIRNDGWRATCWLTKVTYSTQSFRSVLYYVKLEVLSRCAIRCCWTLLGVRDAPNEWEIGKKFQNWFVSQYLTQNETTKGTPAAIPECMLAIGTNSLEGESALLSCHQVFNLQCVLAHAVQVFKLHYESNAPFEGVSSCRMNFPLLWWFGHEIKNWACLEIPSLYHLTNPAGPWPNMDTIFSFFAYICDEKAPLPTHKIFAEKSRFQHYLWAY